MPVEAAAEEAVVAEVEAAAAVVVAEDPPQAAIYQNPLWPQPVPVAAPWARRLRQASALRVLQAPWLSMPSP
jgi:hypothetical protein